MSTRAIAVAALLGVSLGCIGGYWAKVKLDQASSSAASIDARRETSVGIVRAAEASVSLGAQISSDSTRIDQLRVAAAKRTAKYLLKPIAPLNENTAPEAPLSPPDRSHSGLVLDAGTVRLLNAARTGRLVVDPSGDTAQE